MSGRVLKGLRLLYVGLVMIPFMVLAALEDLSKWITDHILGVRYMLDEAIREAG